MMESAGSFVREGNVDGVMMLVRNLEREDKSKLMVDVVRELMRKDKEKKNLNGKLLMELLSELEKEDLEVLWSFLEELARQIVRRLVHHLENFEKDCDFDVFATMHQYDIDVRIWNKIAVVEEILVMELWGELVRKQKETYAGYLVKNIVSGLVKERKMKLVVVLLQKVGCKDQELTGEVLKYVARELVVENRHKPVRLVKVVMEFLSEFVMEDEEQKWRLALGEELAREDVIEDLQMLKYEMESCKGLRMGIVRNVAMEWWRLGSKDLKELKWKQEWKFVMQLLWRLQCKDGTVSHNCLFPRKLEFGMQLLKELGEKLARERRWDFVMELLKEVLMEILMDLSGEFGMECLNHFVEMHYMEIITPEKKWEDLRNVLWLSKEAKLGEDGEELVVELLVVHAVELVKKQRVEQVLREEHFIELAIEPVKAFVREIMSNLSRDQKIQHLWCVIYKHVKLDCPILNWEESRVICILNEFVKYHRLNSEILWRLGMQYWKGPVARKFVREKECKEVMSVVEVLGKKRMWELAMEILGALLNWEEEKGSENVQLIRVFRKHQRDMRQKEEVKRKRSFRKFVDNKVVPRLCEGLAGGMREHVVKFLQRSRRNEVKTTQEHRISESEKFVANKLLECVYADCDVFDESHLKIVMALYSGVVLPRHRPTKSVSSA